MLLVLNLTCHFRDIRHRNPRVIYPWYFLVRFPSWTLISCVQCFAFWGRMGPLPQTPTVFIGPHQEEEGQAPSCLRRSGLLINPSNPSGSVFGVSVMSASQSHWIEKMRGRKIGSKRKLTEDFVGVIWLAFRSSLAKWGRLWHSLFLR